MCRQRGVPAFFYVPILDIIGKDIDPWSASAVMPARSSSMDLNNS